MRGKQQELIHEEGKDPVPPALRLCSGFSARQAVIFSIKNVLITKISFHTKIPHSAVKIRKIHLVQPIKVLSLLC